MDLVEVFESPLFMKTNDDGKKELTDLGVFFLASLGFCIIERFFEICFKSEVKENE